jgi:DNA-binding XRE family transcriptional regulator
MKTIHEESYKNMVAELKKARNMAGLTQAESANKLGFSRQWLHKVETCELRLDVFQLLRLCHLYGQKAHVLVRQMEEKTP